MLYNLLTDIGDICEWIAPIALAIWIIQYSIYAPWWESFIGVTIVWESLVVITIFVPSLMALADPAEFARFASSSWYHWVALAIVVNSAAFAVTRIPVWEYQRRKRGTRALTAGQRVAALEAENEALRERLGDT